MMRRLGCRLDGIGEGFVCGIRRLGVLGDLARLAARELADELRRRPADEAEARVLHEPRVRVGDVEVPHRQLADPVDGAERGVTDAFHRQLLGAVVCLVGMAATGQ